MGWGISAAPGNTAYAGQTIIFIRARVQNAFPEGPVPFFKDTLFRPDYAGVSLRENQPGRYRDLNNYGQ